MIVEKRHASREAHNGGLPERIIAAVFKTADGAITPPVRLNRTPAANEIKSTRSGEQRISDPFRFTDVRPLHGGVNLLCFFAAKTRAD
jgi:hypothetical protein